MVISWKTYRLQTFYLFIFFPLLIMFTILLMSEISLYILMSRLLIFVENFMIVVCSNLFTCSRGWGWLCGLGPLHSCWTSKWIFCFSFGQQSFLDRLICAAWEVQNDCFKVYFTLLVSKLSGDFYTCNLSKITITT